MGCATGAIVGWAIVILLWLRWSTVAVLPPDEPHLLAGRLEAHLEARGVSVKRLRPAGDYLHLRVREPGAPRARLRVRLPSGPGEGFVVSARPAVGPDGIATSAVVSVIVLAGFVALGPVPASGAVVAAVALLLTPLFMWAPMLGIVLRGMRHCAKGLKRHVLAMNDPSSPPGAAPKGAPSLYAGPPRDAMEAWLQEERAGKTSASEYQGSRPPPPSADGPAR
jgi:hypothetical protein